MTPITEAVKAAAEEIPALPTDRRELRWSLGWALVIAMISAPVGLIFEDWVWIPIKAWLR